MQRDQGYSWIILVAAFFNNVVGSSVFTSAAVYMVEWIEQLETTTAEIGLVASLISATACLTGLFMGPFIHRFGFRVTSWIGATLCTTGFILALLSTNVRWLYISYGFIVGVGQGMHSIVPIIIVQYYFDKRRAFASGLSLMGHSTGSFVMMPLIRVLIDQYGWRGAMLLHTGFVIQIYVFGSLYRTPDIPEFAKVHKKKAQKVTQSTADDNHQQINKTESEFKTQLELQKLPDKHHDSPAEKEITAGDKVQSKENGHTRPSNPNTQPINGNAAGEANSSVETVKQVDDNKRLYQPSCCGSVLKFLKSTWKFSLFKDIVFIQIFTAVMFSHLATDLVYRFSSLKAVVEGMDKVQAAFLPAITGLVSTCVRLPVSLVADMRCLNRTLLLGAALLMQGFFAVVCTFATNFASWAVCMAFFGVFTGCRFTLSTTVLVDLIGLGQLAYGSSFISGGAVIPIIISLPLAGYIADTTGNYDIPYYIYGTIHMVGGVLVLLIPLTKRRFRKAQPEEQQQDIGTLGGKQKLENIGKKSAVMKLKDEDKFVHGSLQSINAL